MKSLKLADLTLVAISLLVPTIALGQGANPPASTKESGRTSGRGETTVEQTAMGRTPDKRVPSQQIKQALIVLDRQWGEAGSKGDTATLNKILADDFLAVGPKGEALGKQEQIAVTPSVANVQNASYGADEYKFEMLSPDVVVMTHRATIKGTQDGKEVTESHRSLHVFQKRGGQWQVVANAQLPIAP
jgi:ketosteroid isomerase-like protein